MGPLRVLERICAPTRLSGSVEAKVVLVLMCLLFERIKLSDRLVSHFVCDPGTRVVEARQSSHVTHPRPSAMMHVVRRSCAGALRASSPGLFSQQQSNVALKSLAAYHTTSRYTFASDIVEHFTEITVKTSRCQGHGGCHVVRRGRAFDRCRCDFRLMQLIAV